MKKIRVQVNAALHPDLQKTEALDCMENGEPPGKGIHIIKQGEA